MAYLDVENLSLTIDGKKLLDNISFSLEKGSLTLIAGKNGSGKSLLLKCLKGLEVPNKGARIILDGSELTKSKERMSKIALVFQDTALQIVGSTVERDIAFGPENLRWDKARINTITDCMITMFGLEKVRTNNPETLSGGEKRKLAIAGVLAMEPKLLLLDEPFANLDYPSTKIVIKALETLKENGITVILVSHEAEKFLRHTDNTIIINNGNIVFNDKSRTAMKALMENDVYLPKNVRFEELSWLD